MVESTTAAPNQRATCRERWPDAHDCHLLITGMEDAGMAREEIREWLSAPFRGFQAEEVLELALQWQTSPLPLIVVIEWAQTGVFDPNDALRWHRSGFTAAQAVFINTLMPLSAERLDFDQCQAREEAWMSCGLPPRWACLCAALDVSIPAAHALYARAQHERDVEGLLALYANLRGADTHSLEIDLLRVLGFADDQE